MDDIIVDVYADARLLNAGVGHCVEVICVMAVGTRAATLVEGGVFNVNVTVSVVKNEVADESVRAPEAVIVPAVEPAVCML